VVCDRCGHHYLGTSAKSGRYNYYSCRTPALSAKRRAACNAALLSKEKLETAVLNQIQEQILSEENVAPLYRARSPAGSAVPAKPQRREKP